MKRIAVLACIGLCLPLVGNAQVSDREGVDRSLSNLNTVFLVVQAPQRALIDDGFQTEEVRAEVEELLRDAGLQVAKLEDAPEPGVAQGTLRLIIETSITSTTNRVYAIRLEFRQRVSLVRNPEIRLAATTWFAGDFGMSQRKDMLEIKGSITDLVGRFLADYRTTNPKAKDKK